MVQVRSEPNSWYKTHPNDPTPSSTTHIMMMEGAVPTVQIISVRKKQINFQTYPMDDTRFSLFMHRNQMRPNMTTTYKRDYTPFGFVPRPYQSPHDKPSPDWLFNRRPVNQFGLYPYAATKFMDDHMFDISEARKKVDFFRQIRNAHHPLPKD